MPDGNGVGASARDNRAVGALGYIEYLHERLLALNGWRRRGALFILGGVGALALPPIYAILLLAAAFTGLLILLDQSARRRAAFMTGWWFGLGHFVVGTYWISNSMLTDPVRYGWMIPFAICGLSAVLALFPALATGATASLRPQGPSRILVLAIAWTSTEWLRGWVLTGFPWNLLGYAWAFSDAMNQFAALFGIWGLSFVTVTAMSAPALLFDWAGLRRQGDSRMVRPRATAVILFGVVALLGAIWAAGADRLAGAGNAMVADVRLRIVQPNIDPGQKGNDDLRLANLARHLALTIDTAAFDKATHVIWPETAILFLLERESEVRRAIAAAVPTNGLLLTGVPRAEPATGTIEEFWNSMAAIDPSGTIIATYDKFHLVPYGEYVPWRWLMPFVSRLTPGENDYSAGPGLRTLHLPGLPPVGPLICYEVIFPGSVVDPSDRPAWLLNLTNDGWFGRSTGPYQHLVSARLRAVEEGLPVVRAANTGISAVIDAYGRITARTGLDEAAVLDSDLPRPIDGLTLYARLGDWAAAGLLLVGAVAAWLMRHWH
ncbi:MAG: apolipoprotein N-acyltransferase [Dongiaceae bacterium]